MESKQIPAHLQGFLWSKNVEAIDFQADKTYVIHQILSFGDLVDIEWLLAFYGKEEVKKVFSESPKRLYQPSVFYFVKDILLGMKEKDFDLKEYAKISP